MAFVTSRRLPTVVGLTLALAGPVVVGRLPESDAHPLAANALAQLILWLLLAAVVLIVRCWEKRPLSSIGLKPFHWRSLAWGAALALVGAVVVFPLAMWVLAQTGLPGYESGMRRTLTLPPAYLPFAVVTAGIVEETLYRGYGIERLRELSGNLIAAGIVVLTIHSLAHLPLWGPGPVLVMFLHGLFITAFYLWQRDLLACIVAHTVGDMLGLVIFPLGS